MVALDVTTCGGRNDVPGEEARANMPRMREGIRRHRAILLRLVQRVLNNSQFWTWVDYWECWDFMQDELEDELELEDWADEALWLICLKCGNPLEGCIC